MGKNPVSLAVADYNNDGKADVAVANGSDGTVSVLTGKGTGFFNTATTYTVGSSPTKIVAEDIDADGKMDLVVLCYSDASIYYLKNNGSGFTVQTISGISLSSKSDMIFADINNDGLKDMIVAGNGGVAIFKGADAGGWDAGFFGERGEGKVFLLAAGVEEDACHEEVAGWGMVFAGELGVACAAACDVCVEGHAFLRK